MSSVASLMQDLGLGDGEEVVVAAEEGEEEGEGKAVAKKPASSKALLKKPAASGGDSGDRMILMNDLYVLRTKV
eukprot:2074493-Alexandrium_andersonii.AAC.1